MMQDAQCFGVHAEVYSDNARVPPGSVSFISSALTQLSLATDETILWWELSHNCELCEVIKGHSICSLVPPLSFLIDLFQALEVESCRQRAALPEMSLFIALISSVSRYATGILKT